MELWSFFLVSASFFVLGCITVVVDLFTEREVEEWCAVEPTAADVITLS